MGVVLRYSGAEDYTDPRKRFEVKPGDHVEFEEAEARQLLAEAPELWTRGAAPGEPGPSPEAPEPTQQPENAAAGASDALAGHLTDAHTAGELGVR